MKFSTSVLSNLMLVGAAVAAPSDRLSRRADRGIESHPNNRNGHSSQAVQPTGNISHIEYSSNWAGVVIESPPSGTTFKAVTAEFTVPTPKKGTGSGGSTGWSSSAWVGIDGDTYSTAILQTGVDFSISSSGAVSYDAWYEWYPDYAYDFTGITISAGDVIKTTVTATTTKVSLHRVHD